MRSQRNLAPTFTKCGTPPEAEAFKPEEGKSLLCLWMYCPWAKDPRTEKK